MLTEDDYKMVCGDQDLRVYTQSDQANRARAEELAAEEARAYLGQIYDCDAAFDPPASPLLRNALVTIALYHLSRWLPGRPGGQAREEDYDRAINFLKAAQAGRVTLPIPTLRQKAEAGGGDGSRLNPIMFAGTRPHNFSVL